MLNPQTWLNDQITPRNEYGDAASPVTRHRYLAELVVTNGGFVVTGWGILSYGGGHRRGLEQHEAIDLMQYEAYMRGATDAGVDLFAAFKPYFDEYVAWIERTETTKGE